MLVRDDKPGAHTSNFSLVTFLNVDDVLEGIDEVLQ